MGRQVKFAIGEHVRAKTTILGYGMGENDYYRKVLLEGPTVEGVIIGGCHRSTGTREGGGWDEPPYLAIDKTHFFYEIRTGFTNKPVLAKEEDIQQMKGMYLIPFRKVEMDWPYPPEIIEEMRKQAAMQNRDKHGNFVKGFKDE